MKKYKQPTIPTVEEIEACFVGTNFGTNFGTTDYLTLVKVGLLKTVCGYYNGFTLNQILEELGLIKINRKACRHRITITERGSFTCYEWYCIDRSI